MDNPQSTYFIHDKVCWLMRRMPSSGGYYWEPLGPYCPICKTELFPRSGTYFCANTSCNKDFKLSRLLDLTKQVVTRLFEAKKRTDFPIVSLDLPVGRVSDRKEDENYWVEARLGQKDGKKTAMVLFGDKTMKEEGRSQLFIDIDDGQMRFHANDAHPTSVACRVTIEFKDSITTIEKKKK